MKLRFALTLFFVFTTLCGYSQVGLLFKAVGEGAKALRKKKTDEPAVVDKPFTKSREKIIAKIESEVTYFEIEADGEKVKCRRTTPNQKFELAAEDSSIIRKLINIESLLEANRRDFATIDMRDINLFDFRNDLLSISINGVPGKETYEQELNFYLSHRGNAHRLFLTIIHKEYEKSNYNLVVTYCDSLLSNSAPGQKYLISYETRNSVIQIKADALLKLDKWKEAIQVYDQSNYFKHVYYRALLKFQHGHPDAGCEDLKHASERIKMDIGESGRFEIEEKVNHLMAQKNYK